MFNDILKSIVFFGCETLAFIWKNWRLVSLWIFDDEPKYLDKCASPTDDIWRTYKNIKLVVTFIFKELKNISCLNKLWNERRRGRPKALWMVGINRSGNWIPEDAGHYKPEIQNQIKTLTIVIMKRSIENKFFFLSQIMLIILELILFKTRVIFDDLWMSHAL